MAWTFCSSLVVSCSASRLIWRLRWARWFACRLIRFWLTRTKMASSTPSADTISVRMPKGNGSNGRSGVHPRFTPNHTTNRSRWKTTKLMLPITRVTESLTRSPRERLRTDSSSSRTMASMFLRADSEVARALSSGGFVMAGGDLRSSCLPRASLPHRVVEHRRRRGGDVEGVHPAAHGQADHAVADLAGAGAQALLLAPEAEHDFAREVDLPGRLPLGIGAVDPVALLLQALDLGRRIGDALDLEPLAGAG